MHHRAAVLSLAREASEGFDSWLPRAVVDPCKTFRGACHHEITSFETNKDARPDSKQAANRNKRYTVQSYRTYKNMAQKRIQQAQTSPAPKLRALHNQHLIRPSLASSPSPVHQPLTDPQPQYSLNLSFLPISRLRALTVALSDGFVFPSSRTSPLAFRA